MFYWHHAMSPCSPPDSCRSSMHLWITFCCVKIKMNERMNKNSFILDRLDTKYLLILDWVLRVLRRYHFRRWISCSVVIIPSTTEALLLTNMRNLIFHPLDYVAFKKKENMKLTMETIWRILRRFYFNSSLGLTLIKQKRVRTPYPKPYFLRTKFPKSQLSTKERWYWWTYLLPCFTQLMTLVQKSPSNL